MMRRILLLLVLLLACDGSPVRDDRARELEGTYSGTAFLTVVGTYGPTGAGVAPTSCEGRVIIDSQIGEAIQGTFDRRECAGLARAADVHGMFYGTVLADGSASVSFTEAPLRTSEVFMSAGGCVPVTGALGPYAGRISRSSIRLQTPGFIVNCCCGTRPAPGGGVIVGPSPWYSAEYRIEAFR